MNTTSCVMHVSKIDGTMTVYDDCSDDDREAFDGAEASERTKTFGFRSENVWLIHERVGYALDSTTHAVRLMLRLGPEPKSSR